MPIYGGWDTATNTATTVAVFDPYSTQPMWVQANSQGTATYVPALLGSALYHSGLTCQTTTYNGLGSATLATTVSDGEWVLHQGQYYYLARARAVHFREETEQERQAALAMAEQRRIAAVEQARIVEIAKLRARDLLLEHLTPAQRETFTKNHWFVVRGGMTKTDYQININGYAGNIFALKGGKPVESLCCHCDGGIPLHDQHLAQKLALEYDEERFLRTANRRRIAA